VDVSNLIVHGNLTVISTGGGVDNWTFDVLEVLGQTRLLTDGGADIVHINDSEFFGRLTLLTGAGADQVTISDGDHVTTVGIALIHLGGGDDTLQLGTGVIGAANFMFRVTLQGGLGTDTLNDVNSDFDVAPVILSF
jgi:hypothetical protein